MNNNLKMRWVITITTVIIMVIFLVGMPIILRSSHKTETTKIALTAEQKEVIRQLNIARDEARQAKDELAAMIETAKYAVPVQSGPSVERWLIVGQYDNQNYSIINNGKPILWGFRSDGIVMWKSQ